MLTVSSLSQAKDMLLNEIMPLAAVEPVSLSDALGRVLAGPVIAPADVPAFDRSQVDGLAVRAADTFGASEALPAILHFAGDVPMGQAAGQALEASACISVATGGMLPPGADAMVMIEYVEQLDPLTRLVTHSVSPGSHVTRRGDDTKAGQLVLKAGQVLRSHDLGAIAALGISQVDVLPVVRVGILSTGDELVEPMFGHTAASAGKIFDVNGPMLAGAVRAAGCQAVPYGIIPDQLDRLTAILKQALQETDLVLISGGSSVGARDYVEQAINAAGTPGVLLHGLAVKPGKPTLAGVCQGKVVMGLPGHPVAAWFMFEHLVAPLLSRLGGIPQRHPVTVTARTTSRIPSNHGREEFVLVSLHQDAVDGAWLAEPLATRSGLVTQLTASDGYLRIPRDCEGLAEGTTVTIYLLDEGQVK